MKKSRIATHIASMGYSIVKGGAEFFIKDEQGATIAALYDCKKGGIIEPMPLGTISDEALMIAKAVGALYLDKEVPSASPAEHYNCQPWMNRRLVPDYDIKKISDHRDPLNYRAISENFIKLYKNSMSDEEVEILRKKAERIIIRMSK